MRGASLQTNLRFLESRAAKWVARARGDTRGVKHRCILGILITFIRFCTFSAEPFLQGAEKHAPVCKYIPLTGALLRQASLSQPGEGKIASVRAPSVSFLWPELQRSTLSHA